MRVPLGAAPAGGASRCVGKPHQTWVLGELVLLPCPTRTGALPAWALLPALEQGVGRLGLHRRLLCSGWRRKVTMRTSGFEVATGREEKQGTQVCNNENLEV